METDDKVFLIACIIMLLLVILMGGCAPQLTLEDRIDARVEKYLDEIVAPVILSQGQLIIWNTEAITALLDRIEKLESRHRAQSLCEGVRDESYH